MATFDSCLTWFLYAVASCFGRIQSEDSKTHAPPMIFKEVRSSNQRTASSEFGFRFSAFGVKSKAAKLKRALHLRPRKAHSDHRHHRHVSGFDAFKFSLQAPLFYGVTVSRLLRCSCHQCGDAENASDLMHLDTSATLKTRY